MRAKQTFPIVAAALGCWTLAASAQPAASFADAAKVDAVDKTAMAANGARLDATSADLGKVASSANAGATLPGSGYAPVTKDAALAGSLAASAGHAPRGADFDQTRAPGSIASIVLEASSTKLAKSEFNPN